MNNVKQIAEMVLNNPNKCVLCVIPQCVRGDLCGLPSGEKYRVSASGKGGEDGKA